MTIVDTNVLVDVLSDDPVWRDWSADKLDERGKLGPLCVDDIIYAELASRVDNEATLHQLLDELGIRLERVPVSALFLAGHAFRRYRAGGGPRRSLLSDFFIGAHAEVAGLAILTRDVRRYRAYFPKVELIAPEP